ncbi:hypothetical protein [Tautonia plasticadhaerens]|uniref:hypothetical protein n=1 Tax=Tautonia plasticadhaerens TaxID=2527974 RepID=UPI0011A2E3ED|nr:hypothetical protein [Tautonia plasticadhaerens]
MRVPEEREGADRRVLRLREQLARKLRAAQQQVQAFLLQHGIAEPAGLTRWTAASVDAPRRLELTPEPRLRPDVMLDERQHDRERVARAPRRLEESAGAGRHRETVATPRTAPVEAARRWVAGDEAAKARYRRLVATTGNGKKAIAGMARRLAILLWRLSLSGEPYRAAAWRPGPAPATPERPGSRPRPLPERPSSGAGRPRASEDLRVR